MNKRKNIKNGWYKVLNPEKVVKPLDEHMDSFRTDEKNVFLNYKSSLELKFMRYADFNKYIVRYSLEPFAIKYTKPTDGKIHRYYIDFFVEFSTGHKFLVEIKSKNETLPPKKPKKKTKAAIENYRKALQTYAVNIAKWNAAKKFAENNGMIFCILTEEELGK